MADQVAKWQAIQLMWPKASTAWLADLAPIKKLVAQQQQQSAYNLQKLAELVPFKESALSQQARLAVQTAQNALAEFEQVPKCLTVTPFQAGVSSGQGYNRYLSAPNLISHLVKKLDDSGDEGRPSGDSLAAICILFLTNNYSQLARVLQGFNQLLPIEDLGKAERRAKYLTELETNRQVLPKAGLMPAWQHLPLTRLTVVKQIKANLTAQTANLQGFITNSPLDTLADVLATKQASQKADDQALADLQNNLNQQGQLSQVMGSYLTGGNTSDIRRQLLALKAAPSYDWVLCAGVLIVGEPSGLSMLKEMLSI